MKKLSILLVLALAAALLFTACSGGNIEIQDGTYRAEYADYDQHGYKDYVVITFEDGAVASIEADGVAEDGSLKSASAEYREKMESVQGTYPEKYYKDLINQYLENPDADAIDVVAGATSTSNSFITLLKALEKNVRTGDTKTVIVNR
ncbi:MAG: FMN-binding protein [Oscillospiraceae bacterium]|nr:FMN-binding protein [Oscillospiraceae bacterium]